MRTYPVNLLLEGRRTLVVGGGKIAVRKVAGLLEAGAEVAVVAPDVNAAIKKLSKEGMVKLEMREFRGDDLEGVRLVFAATSDLALNRGIVEMCYRRGVLCCAVDSAWKEGDFITPASFHRGGLTVAISTDGVSCKRAKWAKWNFVKALERGDGATLLALGVDHYSVPLELREGIVPSRERKLAIAAELADAAWIKEFVLLSTCNRIELLAVASPNEARIAALESLLGLEGLAEAPGRVRTGLDAFARVAMIAAGLLSQTPGEKHVAAQVKAAFDEAIGNEWAGPAMKAWLDAAVRVSRDIRAEIEPEIHSFEVEDVAMAYIGDVVGKLKGVEVLLLGTGAVGMGMLGRLEGAGAKVMALYNSAPPSGGDMRPSRGYRPLSDMDTCLAGNRIVVCAVSVDKPILSKETASSISEEPKVLVVDLGVPRNADPELAAAAGNITLANLDDLKHWRRREILDLKEMERVAMRVVECKRSLYNKILEGI